MFIKNTLAFGHQLKFSPFHAFALVVHMLSSIFMFTPMAGYESLTLGNEPSVLPLCHRGTTNTGEPDHPKAVFLVMSDPSMNEL